MRFYRCKCGEHEAWTSMGVSACAKCSKCGSNLALHPDTHVEPAPHEFVEQMVETDSGPRPLSRCRYCHLTRAQIAQVETP